MKPKSDPSSNRRQSRLFKDQLGPLLLDFIDKHHELVVLAERLNWDWFDTYWRQQFSDAGGPMANSSRRVAGLLLLQHMDNLSDERLIAVWITNPYYQYFCGEERFQHKPPINPTTLTKWRKRLGEEGMEWLLTMVLEGAVELGAVKRENLSHLCVDSTVMEKNIAFPTDSALLEKLRGQLVQFMQEQHLSVRQSYSRQGPRIARKIGRYAHAKQFKRMKKAVKTLSNYVGRLQRELSRQCHLLSEQALAQAQQLIKTAKQLRAQARNPKQANKLYSLHEPDVDCIAKGKAHKRYEFGCKVGISCTQEEGFIVGMRSFAGNPYDGHTLDELLQQAETISGEPVKTVAVDLGYRGQHQTQAKVIHKAKKLSRRDKKRLARRSMIEAFIGHMKNDGRLSRCNLKGKMGDALHAILCGVGMNMRLLRNYLREMILLALKLLTNSSKTTQYACIAA